VRQILCAVAVLVLLGAGILRAEARIQEAMLCIDPDIEFPVPCDDDD
jgi:hypothetical protein